MGFLSGLFRTRDAPQDRTVGSNYAFYLGGSTSGKMVNERSAMQMTAVYACVRILAEAIAGLPLHLYKYTDEGGKEKAMDHPLYLPKTPRMPPLMPDGIPLCMSLLFPSPNLETEANPHD